MSKDEIKLKPCPFCGNTEIQIQSNGIGDYFVIFGTGEDDDPGCGVRTDDRQCEGKQFAAERWNRRTP